MTKARQRERARTLRREGKSIGDIAQKLKSSKSSVSGWCRDITLSPSQKNRLQKIRTLRHIPLLRRLAQEKHIRTLQKTETLHRDGMHKVGRMSERDFFIAGLALYWGEGYKQGSGEVGFTNCDPDAIQFFTSWLAASYGVPFSDLVARVTINSTHQSHVESIERFWSKATGIPRAAFTRTSIITTATKKRYGSEKTYHGTLRVKVRRSTDLQRAILGALSCLTSKYKR